MISEFANNIGIHVISGHREVSPEKQTFSDGKPHTLHACKNSTFHRISW